MNKYLHAVGFALGLVAVTVLSAVDSAIMPNECAGVFPLPEGRAYALAWLASYLLSAASFGAFFVQKELRKKLFLPLLFVTFTALAFFAAYRLRSYPLSAVFFGLGLVTDGAMLVVLTKNARFSFAGALLNLFWYGLLTGESIVLSVV